MRRLILSRDKKRLRSPGICMLQAFVGNFVDIDRVSNGSSNSLAHLLRSFFYTGVCMCVQRGVRSAHFGETIVQIVVRIVRTQWNCTPCAMGTKKTLTCLMHIVWMLKLPFFVSKFCSWTRTNRDDERVVLTYP